MHRMAVQKTMQFCRQNLRLLLYSQHISKCQSNIYMRISSLWKLPAIRCYSTSNDKRSYRKMMGQDLEEEPVITSVPDIGHVLEAWHFDVGTSGRLKLSSHLNVSVEALDPQKFPDMNKVFLNMLFIGEHDKSSKKRIDITKNYIVNADLDEDSVDLDLNIDLKEDFKEPHQVMCHLQVPLKYDIDASSKGKADVFVNMLESENITVNTEHGHIFLNNLKSSRVIVKSLSGKIKSKSLVQGNITMETGSKGKIETGRLQGQTIECQTDDGHIKVKAVYGENVKLKTSSGQLLLTNCHGSTVVESDKGDVLIGTMDGDLTADVKHGDVNIFFAREGNHKISSETGNILVKLPSMNSNVELCGKLIDEGDVTIFRKEETYEDNVKKIKGCLAENGDYETSLNVNTKEGRINLESHSWLSSLNLKTNGNKT